MLVDTRKSPATFDLGAGTTIRASMGVLGMRQIDLVVDGQTTRWRRLTGRPRHGVFGSSASTPASAA
jgi:5-enolpyruvylshikimate-3-phosphate synthase